MLLLERYSYQPEGERPRRWSEGDGQRTGCDLRAFLSGLRSIQRAQHPGGEMNFEGDSGRLLSAGCFCSRIRRIRPSLLCCVVVGVVDIQEIFLLEVLL